MHEEKGRGFGSHGEVFTGFIAKRRAFSAPEFNFFLGFVSVEVTVSNLLTTGSSTSVVQTTLLLFGSLIVPADLCHGGLDSEEQVPSFMQYRNQTSPFTVAFQRWEWSF